MSELTRSEDPTGFDIATVLLSEHFCSDSGFGAPYF
jgi:hypothetical protein